MAKLLIVEDSIIVQALLKKLLDTMNDFHYDIASTYAEAKQLLAKRRYEFGIVDRVLKDAPHGEIIALCNKHYLAPIVFTNEIDEDFFDDFEGAQIVEYIQKIRYNNEEYVIKRLQQLYANKQISILLVSDSNIYSSYLKQNLNLHGFKVYNASNNEDAYEKIDLHPELSLVIVDSNEPYLQAINVVEYIRKDKEKNELNILVLSEESNAYSTSSLLHAGANDYLIKEFSRDEFYTRVYQNINKVC